MTQTSPTFDRPLLTIAIPTYNRANYLRGLLSTIFDQLVAQPTVELIVSDNASSDETPAVIEEFEKRGLKLRYLRNEINIGADANFLQCFEQSTGKYLWLLGDDDIVVPGGFSKILSLIEAEDYSLVYLSPYTFEHDYLAERQHDRFHRSAQTISNGLPFIQKIGIMITFVSAFILNKDRYCSIERPPLHNFIGSNLLHIGWLLPVLGSGGTSLIVWEKLLAGRDSYTGSWSICETFGGNLIEALKTALPGNKDIAAAIINPTLSFWFPFMILKIRSSPAFFINHENIHGLLGPLHKSNWRYWVYVVPVAALPYWLARGWYAATRLPNRAVRLLGDWYQHTA